MNPPTQQISEVMNDVRRAYRLLHDYQRMMLDAAAYVGRQLGLTYSGGWAKYSDPCPGSGKGRLDNSAWNWLNMVFYEFFFTQPQADGGQINFSILLISDTGYFFGDSEEGDKQDFSNYASPETSRTCFGVFASADSVNWIGPVYNQGDVRHFIETQGGLPQEYADRGIMGKCYDISRLMSEDETDRLITEIVTEANLRGIPLKRLEMKE